MLLVAWPLACALLVTPLGRWREDVRNGFVVFVTAVTLLGATMLVPLVSADRVIGATVPLMLGELVFAVDSYAMLFAIFTAFLWFAATLYSLDYLKHEHKRDRFHTASLVALSAMLGLVLAGDLVTLYLFFEVLGLVAFLLVIHTETDEAKRAAVKYVWMTVLGGFALIAGIFLTYEIGGNGALLPLPLESASESLKWVTFGLLVLGFGVKAGMLPVHVWLPDAHPVAPSPASALLSGVMIKAGAYGIFRTATALFRPPVAEEVEEALWHATADFGLVILWIGIATMAVGVIMALGQSNAKRMLAYHSISQMGFILAGVGAAAYLGAHGAMGVAGGLYHVVNHALFKGALFLGVGIVAYRTGELDMYKLGGLWRRMPWTFVLMLIAAAGITGVPLFNGFVSKCLIHHALVESYEFGHLASLSIAEKIYVVTCGGTACSFIKLIGFVFLGSAKRDYGPEVKDPPVRMLAAMGMLGAAIIALGLWPQILIRGVFEPGLQTWGLNYEVLEEYLTEMFLSPADLMSVVVAFAIGGVAFVVGVRFGLFHLHAPAWFGVNFWYLALARGFVAGCGAIQRAYESYLAWLPRVTRPAWVRSVAFVRTTYDDYLHAISRARTPEPPNEHFLRDASLVLLAEQQRAVREAMSERERLHRHTGTETAVPADADSRAVRDAASFLAERLREHRVEVLAELARLDKLKDVRAGFARVLSDARSSNAALAQVALDLGQRAASGEDVSDELAVTAGAIIREEDFVRRLLDTEAPVRKPTGKEWRAVGTSRMRIAFAWVEDVLRMLTEVSIQEQIESYALRDEAATVVATRRQIQRYARDMSFNVAVILIVLLAILASIVAGSG